jgi:hypothetical protein
MYGAVELQITNGQRGSEIAKRLRRVLEYGAVDLVNEGVCLALEKASFSPD